MKVRERGAEKIAIYRIAGSEADKGKDGVEPDYSSITLELHDDRFERVEGAEPLRFSTELSDDILILTPEGKPDEPLRFRRKDTSRYLLKTRGFRWINEAPYNRP